MFDFPAAWPPDLSKQQLETLTSHATTYALSHGLTHLPPTSHQLCIPTSVVHAPFALLPSPFPRRLFEKARRLQRSYNILYARVAMDVDFLDRVMGAEQGVGKADSYIGQLWRGWRELREAGLVQPFHLGLFRSDYLLHLQPDADEKLTIKQVEFNTIACGFGGLSPKTTALHRYLYSATNFFSNSPYLNSMNFPDNETTVGLAEGLAKAHHAYGVNDAQILFVVRQGERKVFDQRCLEYELLAKYSIKVIRRTLDELENCASVDPESSILKIECHPDLNQTGYSEISMVYYRGTLSPNKYTATHYNTRFLLERSKAIKCPPIPLRLAGSKKVQEVLTQPGVLEYFLANGRKYGGDVLSQGDMAELRESFMEMWGLDVGEDMITTDSEAIVSGKENLGIRKVRESPMSLVLKPQREGGGHNVYKESIPEFLDRLPPEERQAWVAMRLIEPPDCGNYLIREGSTNDHKLVKTATVSELGIFGWALFGGPDGTVDEKEVGFLLRTKDKESNEGGVSAGFAVLDSPLLFDVS